MSGSKSSVTMRNMNLYPMTLARLLRKSDMKNKERYNTLDHQVLNITKDNQKTTIFKLPAGL